MGSLLVVGLVAVMLRVLGSDPDADSLRVGQTEGEVAAERAYLADVEAVQAIRDEQDAELADLLGATYLVPERMWEVAQDIQLRAATDEALATAARFDPPVRYRDEHELWVASLDASRRHLQDSQEALERRDLVAMMVAFMRSELELVARLPDWSEEYCRAVFPKAIPPEADVLGQGPDAVCRRDELSPGGDYGRQLRMVVLRTELAVGRRIGLSGVPAFTEEQRLAFLSIIQPEVEELLEGALAAVQALEPPAELADDHELVVRFYRDILDIARRITVVAEQGRAAQFEALARESLEPGRSLRRQLSEHGCAILDRFGFFSDAQGC